MKDLIQAMGECNQEEVVRLVSRYMEKEPEIRKILDALTAGLRGLGDRFSRGEAFIPELVFGGEIFQEAMKILGPRMGGAEAKGQSRGKVLMATVKGDLHDIGKNLVISFLGVGGYEVIDMGCDVPNEVLIEAVRAEKPDVIGLSALLTTTMMGQRQFMEMLRGSGLRDRVKVIVGGAPLSQAWAEEIGADAFGADAVDGKKKIDALLGKA